MTATSASKPFVLRPAQPVSAAFGSRSATMTFAPASPSASAQARPIPCPAPVTTAIRPPSANFSRYISLFLFTDGLVRQRSRPNGRAVLVETVQSDRIRRQPDAIAGLQIELSDAA